MEKSQLKQLLAKGGEGEIFTTPNPLLLAKVFHPGKMTSEVEQKLRAMLANPPQDAMRLQGRVSIAWPVDLVMVNGVVQGYLMPRLEKAKDEDLKDPHLNLSKCRDLIDFYNPSTRRKLFPWFHYIYLMRTARNIAIATVPLHAKGYVIGDLNESNILVALDTIATFVDTDSFQVPGQGTFYRSQVGKPEYTPPELQGVPFKDVDRTQAHDLFGLAVIIFQLLMQGQHPFAGKYEGQGEAPEIKDRIKAGHFPHGNQQVPYSPVPIAPSFDILPLRLQDLFIQCFEAGHHDPASRPTAKQWSQALEEAEQELQQCSTNPHHSYAGHLLRCPWCELSQKFGGLDPFPSPSEIQQGRHLQNSNLAEAYYHRGLAKYDLGDKQDAISDYNQAIKRNPNLAEAYYHRGLAKYDLGDKQGAIVDYNQAIKRNPNLAEAWYHRGLAKYDLGDKQGAIIDYNQAIKRNPNLAEAYYHRGLAQYDLGDKQGAIIDYNQAIKLNSNLALAYYYRGLAQYDVGYKQDAIINYSQAIILNPNLAEAYIVRGNAKYDLGDKQGAIIDYDQAIKLNPNLALAYYNRGLAKYDLGDKQGAINDMTIAAELFRQQGSINLYQEALGFLIDVFFVSTELTMLDFG